jgi:hypothetical protein
MVYWISYRGKHMVITEDIYHQPATVPAALAAGRFQSYVVGGALRVRPGIRLYILRRVTRRKIFFSDLYP